MLKFLSKIPLLGRLFGGGAAAAGTAGAKSGLMSKLGLGAAGLAVGDQFGSLFDNLRYENVLEILDSLINHCSYFLENVVSQWSEGLMVSFV